MGEGVELVAMRVMAVTIGLAPPCFWKGPHPLVIALVIDTVRLL